jgi:rRNA maturation protein Nop10
MAQNFTLSAFLSVWRGVVVDRVDVSEEHVASIHPTHFSPQDGSTMFLIIVGMDRVDVSEEHVASIHPTHFSPEDGSTMFLIIVGNTANFRRYILNEL